jgi:hypothetical protein
MPLTLELYKNGETIGRFVIERKTVLFQFFPKSPSSLHKLEANQLLEEFGSLLIREPESKLSSEFGPEDDFLPPEDPRHLANDHLSEADKGPVHLHLKFKRNVDHKIMQTLFSAMPMEKWLTFFSKDCMMGLMTATEHYLKEMEEKACTPHDATPLAIEQDYQAEKDAEFKKAELAMNQKREKKEDNFGDLELKSLDSPRSVDSLDSPRSTDSPRRDLDMVFFSSNNSNQPVMRIYTVGSALFMEMNNPSSHQESKASSADYKLKLVGILQKIRGHTFILNSGGTKREESAFGLTFEYYFPKSIARIYDTLNAAMNQRLTQEIYDNIIRKIFAELSEKTKATKGILGIKLFTRDESTAQFNLAILDMIKDDTQRLGLQITTKKMVRASL